MRRIRYFDELNSTSVYAHQHLEVLSNFQVISCDLQTCGHGQFERKWFSSNKNGGNIYISIILKPIIILMTHKKGQYKYCPHCGAEMRNSK